MLIEGGCWTRGVMAVPPLDQEKQSYHCLLVYCWFPTNAAAVGPEDISQDSRILLSALGKWESIGVHVRRA